MVTFLLHKTKGSAENTAYESRFSDDLFDHLLSKDMQGFWKVWAHKTCKSVISVDSIDGETDDLEIANAFRDSLNVCSNRKDSRC